MLAPCLFRNAGPASAPLQSQILEFFLLASSGHGLQDACTVPRCSCRGKAPVNYKPWSLGRAAQAPRCQSWRQEVTRSVGPPQTLNTKIREKGAGVPMKDSPPESPVLWISSRSQHETTKLSKIPYSGAHTN